MINMAEIKLTEEEIGAAVQVLRSGALRQGKECAAFEKEFADKVGAKYAVTCASGSAALHLSYMAFLEPGDEVLVPSFTFIATGSMVAMASGKPVFCDVNPQSFLINLEDAERRVTEHTRAIAPVHLFGNVCDIDAVKAFATKHDLIVVWDAAQAHGACFEHKDVGSFGDFVCYSFYPSKNMFVGEGGMICVNNEELSEKLRFTCSHGQTGKYYHTMLGFNYRMTDVEAAIGREQLKRLDKMVGIRRKNAQMLNHGLSAMHGLRPQVMTPNTEHAYHQYCILVIPDEFGFSRDELSKMLANKGISTGVHYPRGLHQQPVFEEMYGKQTLEVTEYICEHILALPVHHGLLKEDIQYIIDVTTQIHNARKNK